MKFKEVKIHRPSIFRDYRGDYWTLWHADEDEGEGLSWLKFNHDKVSTSRKHVLRGIHGDSKSHKLLTCLQGEVYCVAVDNREDSSTYLQWDWIMLDDKSRDRILLPPGFGVGYLILSERAVMHYKWAYNGEYPDVDQQFSLRWDDEKMAINWPIKNPILSKRDGAL
jgi:dTDP-4-dehydrorhamnose 3,5-epimerase